MSGNQSVQDPSLLRFMQSKKPQARQSKLMPFKEQIAFLKAQGFSDNQVIEYLKEEKGVEISQPAFNIFFHKYIKNQAVKTVSTTIEQKPVNVVLQKPIIKQQNKEKQVVEINKTEERLPEKPQEKNSQIHISRMSDKEAQDWLSPAK